MILFEWGLVVGLVAVASNPSPYYAALGLVGSAGFGCLVLLNGGASFLSLVLFLIYLGGMMVVFAYSAALVAEPYPEAWGSVGVVLYLVIYVILFSGWWMMSGNMEKVMVSENTGVGVNSWFGISMLYSLGGSLLFVVGWALLLTLFVVLEVVRGHCVGALRAV